MTKDNIILELYKDKKNIYEEFAFVVKYIVEQLLVSEHIKIVLVHREMEFSVQEVSCIKIVFSSQ